MILRINNFIFNNIIDTIKNNRIFMVILVLFLSSISIGCIGSENHVSYGIFITPSNNSETILIIPLVIDTNSGRADQIMLDNPLSIKGTTDFAIIDTDKGPAIRIITREVTEIWFSKDYKENGAELRENKMLSMTNITFDEKGKPIMKSWLYINSTEGQISKFMVSLHAGDSDQVRILSIGERNVTNGWHQFTVEEGIGIS